MRYIGNKTKLLPFIGAVLDDLGVRPGKAADPFAGTASVAQYLKRRGFQVDCCDIMSYSYVFQRAYVQLDSLPRFERLLEGDAEIRTALARPEFRAAQRRQTDTQMELFDCSDQAATGPLRRVLLYLESFLPGLNSLLTREFSAEPGDQSGSGRMFFTASNARRIDAIRTRLEEWRRDELLGDDEFYLLLASLLEAADSVANTTGVYAAFVKSWQPNARRPLRLRVPDLALGTGLRCSANRGDANQFVRRVNALDLVYLDPPYNSRQYSAYYHIPELISEGWFETEPALRGKTGLIPDAHKRSAWSVPAQCVVAFRDLMARLDAKRVLLSYSSEGIIPAEEVTAIFEELGVPGSFQRHALDYARYRSDRDHASRNYKADRVTEYIFSVELATSG